MPETQAGFRSGKSTIDNIQVLNYIANREINHKEGKLFVFFADLTVAFDKINRKLLSRIMEQKGINGILRLRIDEIYKETRNRVKVNNQLSDTFWTTKGVRQGCPLSPTLFSLYTADLEEQLKRGQAGGITIRRVKIWTLVYADDIASGEIPRRKGNDEKDEKIPGEQRISAKCQ